MTSYPYRDLYKTTISLGLSPSEFWRMSPDEVGEWYNAKRPMKYYGRMDEKQAQRITDRIRANEDRYS